MAISMEPEQDIVTKDNSPWIHYLQLGHTSYLYNFQKLSPYYEPMKKIKPLIKSVSSWS